MNPSASGNPPSNVFSGNENYPNQDYLYDKITSQENTTNIKIYICAFTINKELDTHFVKYIVQQKDSLVSLPFFQEQNPGQMSGGFKDDSNEEKDLDKMFKTKVSQFAKSIYPNASEPFYLGYIPNISETDSIFVFVNIENPGQLNPEYIETVPNELVFLSKVYNFDIDQPLKDLFANNTWLYMKQSLASPFSGYICKQNEQKQYVNVPKEEAENVYDQFLINNDGIGNYYYFSFLPIDAQNAGIYQRFALFPIEYDCILDNNNLEYYKQNINSFEQSDSIYFKDGILIEGHRFFALKTPMQFTKI